jgi:hypothetical protein
MFAKLSGNGEVNNSIISTIGNPDSTFSVRVIPSVIKPIQSAAKQPQ